MSRRVRWMIFVLVPMVVVSLLPSVTRAQTPAALQFPAIAEPAGPVDRPAPASARPDEAVPPDKIAPPVPLGVKAGGAPVILPLTAWERTLSAVAAQEVFANVQLRSGFVLGDTSLVGYFDVRDQDPAWTSWTVRLYDAATMTEQASTNIPRSELVQPCGAVRQFCRSFGSEQGWILDPAKEYFITIAAVFPDAPEVVSPESNRAKPRTTVIPPPIPAKQASGCGCGSALGMTAAKQAMRGDGVNTATGAFTRVETDLVMNSFGIPFGSARVYSSVNADVVGPFGPGWAWSYGMRVTAGEAGAVVRADDGAEVLYRLVDGVYQRPAGVRSNLRRAGDGWELVTLRGVVYGFDAQGRLVFIRSPRGVGVSLAYTVAGITITDASGRAVQVRISGGLIREMLMPDQRKVQYEYDTAGRLVVYKDPRARQWRYTYDAANRITEIIDPQPLRVVLARNEYRPDGRVGRQIDAVGNATRFDWDGPNQVATTIDADNVSVIDAYRDNVLLFSRRGNGDTDNHRYDPTLNKNLVVDSNHNQHEGSFDGSGNPTQRNAPQEMGFNEKTKFDERNNPIEYTDANGVVWRNTYNEFNELVSSVDGEGHAIRYAYDSRGLLTSMTDQREKVTRYEYIPAGQPNAGLLLASVSPEGRRSESRYDPTGRQIRTIDPRGFATSVTYDEQDRVLTVTEPGKLHPSRTTYDEVGRVTSTVSPVSLEIRYTYLDNGRLVAVTDPRRTTHITYTAAGRRASIRIGMNGQGPDIVTTYRYNVKGLLHEVISPRGNVAGANPAEFTTTYRYDANDNLVRISRPYPGGQVVHKDIQPDGLDRTVGTVDENNRPSTFTRANTGEVTGANDTLGRPISMTYDNNGRQTGITNAGQNTSRFQYDAAGNKIRQETAEGGVTTWTYTDDGMLATMTEPRGNAPGANPADFTTRFEYDLAGNATRTVDPLGNATVSEYDGNNRVTSVTDARGNSTRYRYREDNQIETVHSADAVFHPEAPHNNATVFNYTEDGLLASVRDPNLHVKRMEYDTAGRMSAMIDPLSRRTELSYDTENNVVSGLTRLENESLTPEQRAARTIVDTYDIANRRERRALGTGGPVYQWRYDLKDRITAYVDPVGAREMTYDDEDQIRKVVRTDAGGQPQTFEYGYDARGNITSRSYPDGTRIGATYDKDSRITQVTAEGGAAGATPATWTFGYDLAGRRTSTTLPGPTGVTETRTYDNAGRLTSIGATRASQEAVSAFRLELDPVGNPVKVTTTRGGVSEAVAYAYDKTDRVTAACYAANSCEPGAAAAGRIDYTYDLVGNRKSQKKTGTAGNEITNYDYDNADQLTRQTVISGTTAFATDYAYDLQGNQTRAGPDTFAYNLDHTLARATVGGQTTTFSYDAQGLRLAAKVGTGDATATRLWSWDVSGTLPQIALDTVVDAAGAQVDKRGFTYGPDDEPLALLDPATGAHSYTHDWLGGIANMLSPSGANEAGYDYDPFGNPRQGDTLSAGGGAQFVDGGRSGGSVAENAAGPANPLQFTGAYQDSSSGDGNYYLRARNYNPGTGRFTSVDPMPQAGRADSVYAYAENNPLSYTDPTGAFVEADGGGTGGAPLETGSTEPTSPSPEDLAKAQQIQSKSVLDVILEAGGQVLMEFLGINDLMNCLGGDLGACVMLVIGSLPWGKIFKAKKIAEAIFRAGKAVVTFFQEIKWAKAIIRGAEKAAEAAKAAAAAAAKAAAEKAAKAKAAAEAAARKAAAEAAARAKALAAKAKAATKKKADGGDCGCVCKAAHSFATGTRILLADGKSKPIEEVEPGDTVRATDPASGKGEDRQVTHTIRTEHDKKYVDLTIRDEKGGDQTLTATDNHPFWSETRQDWVHAGKLHKGELLRTSAGTYVQVGAVRHYHAQQPTYDLTVDGVHTYFVLAGDTSVLVHNASCPHRVEVTVHDANGRIRNEYGTWSGDGVPGERALGGWPAQRYTDTENRVARMSGATPRLKVANDPYAGLHPVFPGETVVIKSLMGKAPCNSCKAAMSDAARQLDAKFVYQWVDDAGVDRFWWTGR
ncbi:MAG TPA: polymorphic toxin-type HINT domain-containing protein [Candidatus Limnocylindrales bacterium]